MCLSTLSDIRVDSTTNDYTCKILNYFNHVVQFPVFNIENVQDFPQLGWLNESSKFMQKVFMREHCFSSLILLSVKHQSMWLWYSYHSIKWCLQVNYYFHILTVNIFNNFDYLILLRYLNLRKCTSISSMAQRRKSLLIFSCMGMTTFPCYSSLIRWNISVEKLITIMYESYLNCNIKMNK